jgi:hypothetical protein
MNAICRTIGVIILLLMNRIAGAQTVPWSTPSVSLNSVALVINCLPRVNDLPLSEGDYIGIFDDSGRCFGLARWKDTTNFRVTVYGSDGNVDGFNNGDNLNFKVWLSSENCILEHVSRIESDNPLIYTNTVTNSVNTLQFERLTVEYPRMEFCLNEDAVKPLFSYPADVSFTSSTDLSLESSSGEIDPVRSKPGTYTVALNSDRCLSRSNLSLTLNDVPSITPMPDTVICGTSLALSLSTSASYDNIQWSTGSNTAGAVITQPAEVWYTVTNVKGCSNSDTFNVRKIAIKNIRYNIENADCYRQGQLDILDQEIDNGRPPYQYRLTNRIDNVELTDLNTVPEGAYNLEIINNNGCVLRYMTTLIVEKDCLRDKPVFSPNEDGMDDRYFIEFEGPISIYDRNGSLRRKLTGPVYFDGNDSKGNPLPMGTYLVVSESGKNITLTIIR